MNSVVTWNPQFKQDFSDLNTQWIRKYFVIEPQDIYQLAHPEENIINVGGEIFFVLEDGIPLGTCAMVPHGEKCYELAKMGVAPEARGKGYGDLLMKACIEWAKSKDAEKIMLLSNTILEPAIHLYKKFGFKTVSLEGHPDYKRCNIEMELSLI